MRTTAKLLALVFACTALQVPTCGFCGHGIPVRSPKRAGLLSLFVAPHALPPCSAKRVRAVFALESLRAARWPIEKELAASSRKGDARTVEDLLKAGADANGADEWGSTCLHLAAKSGHDEVVKLLLENSADPHRASHSDDETTPLHAAALAGHTGVCEALLQRGADVLRKDEFGSTPLQLAMKKKHSAVVELLKPNHNKKAELERKEETARREEERARRQSKDSERAIAQSNVGKAFSQSEAEQLLEEATDWEAAELGRDGGGGSVVQVVTDPDTGQKFVRRVPIKKGADQLFKDPDAGTQDS